MNVLRLVHSKKMPQEKHTMYFWKLRATKFMSYKNFSYISVETYPAATQKHVFVLTSAISDDVIGRTKALQMRRCAATA